MPRPKCAEKTVSDRLPSELQQDIEDAAGKLRCRRRNGESKRLSSS